MRLRFLCAATAALLAPMACTAGPAPAAAPPTAPGAETATLPATLAVPPFSMRYDVLHGNLKLGEATFTLKRDNGDWFFAWRAYPTGLAAVFVHSSFNETSRFYMVHGQIRPLAYSYTDTGHADRDETIDFDWGRKSAFDTNDGRKKTIALAPGMLDRISSLLAISLRLAAGLPLPTTYQVINGGRVRTYTVKELRKGTIKTPAGPFHTVVVQRSDSDSDKTLVVWLAPKYAWLPVRLEQREPGETTDTSILTRLKWLHTLPSSAASPQ